MAAGHDQIAEYLTEVRPQPRTRVVCEQLTHSLLDHDDVIQRRYRSSRDYWILADMLPRQDQVQTRLELAEQSFQRITSQH
jgi:hypothetical protein